MAKKKTSWPSPKTSELKSEQKINTNHIKTRGNHRQSLFTPSRIDGGSRTTFLGRDSTRLHPEMQSYGQQTSEMHRKKIWKESKVHSLSQSVSQTVREWNKPQEIFRSRLPTWPDSTPSPLPSIDDSNSMNYKKAGSCQVNLEEVHSEIIHVFAAQHSRLQPFVHLEYQGDTKEEMTLFVQPFTSSRWQQRDDGRQRWGAKWNSALLFDRVKAKFVHPTESCRHWKRSPSAQLSYNYVMSYSRP